ncbi:MAG TPA: DNA-binding protein [Epsilonproteobacteria bacterium]|nr:DNA-binding protein [Campylobacterota bacterium]
MFKQIYLLCCMTLPLLSSEYTAHMAQNHIGEKATVCGTVVSAHYANSSNGEPTFLNLDEAYPNHVFTAVIWGENRERFDEPEVKYRGKSICVTGKIKSYRGIAQMILYSKEQIVLK